MRILLMDDDVIFGQKLARDLQAEGHDVQTSASATEARAALETEKFDLLITDLMVYAGGRTVPDGGITLIHWVRSQKHALNSRNLPIITISGVTARRGLENLINVSKTLGANAGLTKPIDMDELRSRIAQLA